MKASDEGYTVVLENIAIGYRVRLIAGEWNDVNLFSASDYFTIEDKKFSDFQEASLEAKKIFTEYKRNTKRAMFALRLK